MGKEKKSCFPARGKGGRKKKKDWFWLFPYSSPRETNLWISGVGRMKDLERQRSLVDGGKGEKGKRLSSWKGE